MQGNNFFFTGGTDPLLATTANYNAQCQELERMKQIIAQREQALQQLKGQIEQPQQPQQSRTPVWDEIDGITQGLSEKEFQLIAGNDEFIESQNAIMGILQAKYMQMMRPVVEGSQEGKDALERHLTLLKRLKKSASSEVDKEISDFQEYKEKYADMPYSEYTKMKREKTKKK